MKVVTGEKDADASDPTAFDDEHLGEVLDTSPKASAGAATAPSPELPTPTPSETESAPTPTSDGPKPVGLEEGEQSGPHIKNNRVILNENPDWQLVADTFKRFIPVCKTIEALKAFWNENIKELEQFKAGSRDKEPLIPQPPSEVDTARA